MQHARLDPPAAAGVAGTRRPIPTFLHAAAGLVDFTKKWCHPPVAAGGRHVIPLA